MNRPQPLDSIYIHIPFCLNRCGYCAFNSSPLGGRDPAPYVDAILREAERARAEYRVTAPIRTMFIGGGTPTILVPKELTRLIDGIFDLFSFERQAEISVEANPNRADKNTFTTLRSLGVNRLSIGIQSFNDPTLKRIGRSHSAKEAKAAIEGARKAGFVNLNLDLIRGLPGEDEEAWRRSLATAISLGPDHLSIYDLSIEEGSAFHRSPKNLDLPDEVTVEAMDELTREMTSTAGFERYEISNYCRPGRECRHNINYWQNRQYLGLGAGAVSYIETMRLTNVADADLYQARVKGGLAVEGFEILPEEARIRETVIMGLRMKAGVDLAMRSEDGRDLVALYGDTLPRLKGLGLIEMSDGRLRLTELGMRYANQVMAELI